jgi:HNH endonuclease
MLCIFCRNEREPSVEHVFPDAIGGTLTIDREPCNDWLGAHVDVHLTDHLAILMKRHLLKLPNRDGKTIRFDQILGLGTLASDPNQRVKFVREPGTERQMPQLLPKSERIKSDDGTENIRITIDASQADHLGKIIERTRKREGLPALSSTELQAAVEIARAQVGIVERPEVLYNSSFDLILYRKTIYKIVYELAWLWLGDEYLDDPIASKLRSVILQGGGEEELRGQILIGEFAPFDTLWKDEPYAHVAFAKQAWPWIAISVRIFDMICGSIAVTEDPSRYPNFTEGFFCCQPQTGENRRTTLAQELARMMQAKHGCRCA